MSKNSGHNPYCGGKVYIPCSGDLTVEHVDGGVVISPELYQAIGIYYSSNQQDDSCPFD